MKVLVTGGAGFLGRHVVARLAALGAEVSVLDDLSCENSTFDCEELRRGDLRCVPGSVFDEPLLRSLVHDRDVVIHFASVVGVECTIANPIPTIHNLRGTLSLGAMLRPSQVVVFGSSADVYGLHSRLYEGAMREGDVVVFEDASVDRWVYPKVKALEESVVAHCPARSVAVRIFNSYGPGMDHPAAKRVLPQFIDRVFSRQSLRISGRGLQRRSFCYYTDTVDGILLAATSALRFAPGGHDVYNIGHPTPVSILELAETLNAEALRLGIVSRHLPIEFDSALYSQPFDDTWHRAPDISKARNELGFLPRVELQEGLRLTLQAHASRVAAPVVAGPSIEGA